MATVVATNDPYVAILFGQNINIFKCKDVTIETLPISEYTFDWPDNVIPTRLSQLNVYMSNVTEYSFNLSMVDTDRVMILIKFQDSRGPVKFKHKGRIQSFDNIITPNSRDIRIRSSVVEPTTPLEYCPCWRKPFQPEREEQLTDKLWWGVQADYFDEPGPDYDPSYADLIRTMIKHVL